MSTTKTHNSKGIVHIQARFNNTLITITRAAATAGESSSTIQETVIASSSCGAVGFKGSKKSTPYAANETAKACAEKAYKKGIREAEVIIKGPGPSRESIIRNLLKSGITITRIQDRTPTPHNGCRPPKKRNL